MKNRILSSILCALCIPVIKRFE